MTIFVWPIKKKEKETTYLDQNQLDDPHLLQMQ